MKSSGFGPRTTPLPRGSGFRPRAVSLAPVLFPSGQGPARSPWVRTVPGVPVRGVAEVKTAATRRGSAAGSLIAPPPSEFSKKVRALVRKRAGNGDPFEAMCEAGGEFLGYDGGEFQHRAARGAGGCRDEVINGCANCCLLCPRCHRKAEARLSCMGMKWAGFWIEHGTTAEFDPRSVSILLASPHGSGIEVWLAEDGKGPLGTGYLMQRPELELTS